jgi:hypothetical protein
LRECNSRWEDLRGETIEEIAAKDKSQTFEKCAAAQRRKEDTRRQKDKEKEIRQKEQEPLTADRANSPAFFAALSGRFVAPSQLMPSHRRSRSRVGSTPLSGVAMR